VSKIKLDKGQRARAVDLYEYMSDDDNILEDVAQDLIYNRDRANKAEAENERLRWRVAFSKDMLDDWDIACQPCQHKVAHKFTERMKAIQKEKEGGGE